eukprot:705543-Rhodomonas_salina.2
MLGANLGYKYLHQPNPCASIRVGIGPRLFSRCGTLSSRVAEPSRQNDGIPIDESICVLQTFACLQWLDLPVSPPLPISTLDSTSAPSPDPQC